MSVALPEEIERQFTPEEKSGFICAWVCSLTIVCPWDRALPLPASHRANFSTNWAAGGFPSTTKKRMP